MLEKSIFKLLTILELPWLMIKVVVSALSNQRCKNWSKIGSSNKEQNSMPKAVKI